LGWLLASRRVRPLSPPASSAPNERPRSFLAVGRSSESLDGPTVHLGRPEASMPTRPDTRGEAASGTETDRAARRARTWCRPAPEPSRRSRSSPGERASLIHRKDTSQPRSGAACLQISTPRRGLFRYGLACRTVSLGIDLDGGRAVEHWRARIRRALPYS
jgi:hypothetical protein